MIPPRVLIVAGSDSGGGAGLQADIKTCEANGAFACNAVTAVTAQNTRGVHGIVGIDAEFVVAQMDAVLGDIGADAIKTGMLFVAGDVLIDADAIDAVRHELLPLATIATPNRREAAVLLGAADPPRTLAELRAAAADVHGRFRPHSVLVKGGDLADATALTNAVRLDRGPPLVVDVFYDGTVFAEFVSSKLDTRNTHGTGCTLASAIAARLAAGDPLLDAVKAAKTYLDAALRASACVHLGDGGYGPFVHAPAFWSARERVETSAGT